VTAVSAKALTVEIHDVSPVTREECETILSALETVDVTRPTLLVIPKHQDEGSYRWDLRKHPEMVDWLRRRQDKGSEIIQHGYTHRAPAPPPPGMVNAFMHHCFSRGCAEFAHLDRYEATQRLENGRRVLDQCGLRVQGFIAPAWQQSAEAISVLSELGYRFTAFFGHVLSLTGSREVVESPALTFDAPGKLIDHGKRIIMRLVEDFWSSAPLVRVALHPADVRGARPLDHILTRIRHLVRSREVVSYAEWLS
jgi:uncharacterized protein